MALDRIGIATSFANMLKADTSTLYGSNKLLQIIDPNPVNFSNAKVNAKRAQYGLYLWVNDETTNVCRSQNTDEIFTINMRFEAIEMDILAAITNIDHAYERVKLLANTQMWNGLILSQYYSDSNAQIINIDVLASGFPPPKKNENSIIVTEIESAIQIEINRWR